MGVSQDLVSVNLLAAENLDLFTPLAPSPFSPACGHKKVPETCIFIYAFFLTCFFPPSWEILCTSAVRQGSILSTAPVQHHWPFFQLPFLVSPLLRWNLYVLQLWIKWKFVQSVSEINWNGSYFCFSENWSCPPAGVVVWKMFHYTFGCWDKQQIFILARILSHRLMLRSEKASKIPSGNCGEIFYNNKKTLSPLETW